MDFLNDLGRKFTKAARSVQEMTLDTVESSRLAEKVREYSVRSELENLHAEIGRAYLKSLDGEGDVPAELIERARAVAKRLAAMEGPKDADLRRCPHCGTPADKSSAYCSRCGKPLPDDAPAPAVSAMPEADEPEYCADCGAMRQSGSKYCAVCGAAYAKDGSVVPAKPHVEFAPVEDLPEEPDNFEE